MKIKKLLSLLVLCFFFNAFSQTTEQHAVIPTNSSAEYPGGRLAFRNDFMKMVYAYVDVTAYAVNGKFTFIIDVDKNGKMTGLKSHPRVKNDAEFVQDMTFALKKIKKKWKPELRNGEPIETKVIFEINFSTDHADHGD